MTKSTFIRSFAILTGILASSAAFAGSSDDATVVTTSVTTSVQSAAEREAQRRYDRAERIGRDAIDAGDKALDEKDYATAFAQFKLACDNIPNAPRTKRLYASALDGLCESGVKLAEQRIAEGRYADAKATLTTVLDDRYDPRCKEAVVLLSRLETPGYYNTTITPTFRGKVEEVKQLLLEADGFYQTGRNDQAFKRCEQALNIDRYNIAARKMQEKINLARDNYALSAYNEARSRAIWKLDDAWGNPVRKFGTDKGGIVVQTSNNDAGTAVIQRKLSKIIIPKLEFRDATIREAVEFLKKKSADLDVTESDPTRRGVNIVLKLESSPSIGVPAAQFPAGNAAPAIPGLEPIPGALPGADAGAGILPSVSPTDARITVSLTNIPLVEALRYVTQLAGLKFKVEPYAVSIVPINTPTDVLVTKEYKVRPGFIGTKPAGGGGDALNPAGPPADATRNGTGIAGRLDAKEFLIAQGVPFPIGASATYLAGSSRLVVRNTQENLELVDTLIDASTGDSIPAQVEIESKFVEITQQNLKELSFDWLLGQFNVGQGGVFAGGGTSGNQPATDPADFPFVGPGGVPVGRSPVTGGNRSGSTAISASAIDALLFGTTGASRLAPALVGLSGVFTDPQFQLVIRALNQKKGVDLLSAPRVTTKSGQRAVIEIIREFRYPTEFDPPQIPQNFGNNGNNGGGGGTALISVAPSSFPVTPTTPTAFETRNTGVTLEVEPVIGPDGYTIDLNLVPQVVEFEGFINYGSPIQTTATNPITGISSTNVITPNVINQPIFSTRKVTTSVSIFDGQTVVLGGLMREDVQKVEDKTPLLGDIPLIGRLFRSSVDQHLKRNLVIFVSARLINPAGEPVHLEEEKEEEVEVIPVPEIPAPELPLMPK